MESDRKAVVLGFIDKNVLILIQALCTLDSFGNFFPTIHLWIQQFCRTPIIPEAEFVVP